MIEPNEQEEELERCCPLCGGRVSDILDDFLNFEERIKKETDWHYSRKVSASYLKVLAKHLELKLKMIEMGLIPK